MRYTIPATPIGMPRMVRGDRWKVRKCVAVYRAFADRARLIVTGHHHRKLEEPVLGLYVTAWFPLPESWSRAQKLRAAGGPHRQRPDGDNILKGVADALLAEDGQVAVMRCAKRWCRPGEAARVEVVIVVG